MKKEDGLISPETIWGREFRVPAIVGLGSCAGFKIDGLHLPRDWEKSIPRLKEIDQDYFRKFLEADCKEANLNPGQIKFDSKTGILEEISIRTEPASRIYLETGFPRREEGIYVGENINNLTGAVILSAMACRFLNCINLNVSYPYIGRGGGGGYGPIDLKIPDKFLKTEQKAMHELNQRKFEIKASNIAGRFGMSLESMEFDNKGILRMYKVSEGNACCYQVDNKGIYYDHNVDTVWQAATLQGIGAAFINELLRGKDNKWY